MTESVDAWRRCSACKKPIDFGARYWTCNVSTCNRKRTALQFCTVSCWEVHLPVARHRESWAEEQTAPTREQAEREAVAAEAPRKPRRIVATERPRQPAAASAGDARPVSSGGDAPAEVLVIASRLKDYIRSVSGYNTSDRVLEPLSDIVREVCDRAIRSATENERKTVLDRDIPKR